MISSIAHPWLRDLLTWPRSVHDPDYRQSWRDWESFVETLTEKISVIDETVPELPPKDLVRVVADTGVAQGSHCTGLPNLS